MSTSHDSYDSVLKEIEQLLKQLSITEKTFSEIRYADQFLRDCVGEDVDTYIDPLSITLKRIGACFSVYGKDEISRGIIKDEEYHVEIEMNLDEIDNAYLLIFWRAVVSSGGSLNFPILITRRSSEMFVFNLPFASPGKSSFSIISFKK